MMTIDQTPPNHARARAKTQNRSFWKAKKWFKSLSLKIKMRHNQNVSVDFLLCWASGTFQQPRAWLGISGSFAFGWLGILLVRLNLPEFVASQPFIFSGF